MGIQSPINYDTVSLKGQRIMLVGGAASSAIIWRSNAARGAPKS